VGAFQLRLPLCPPPLSQAACQKNRLSQTQLAPYIPLLEQLVGNEIYTSGTIMAIFPDNERIISRVTVENVSASVHCTI